MTLKIRLDVPFVLVLVAVSSFLPTAFPYAETGKWKLDLSVLGNVYKPFAKSMFNQTSIFISLTVHCNASNEGEKLIVDWTLRRTGCASEYIQLLRSQEQSKNAEEFLHHPGAKYQAIKTTLEGKSSYCRIGYIRGTNTTVTCRGQPSRVFLKASANYVEKDLCENYSFQAETHDEVKGKTPTVAAKSPTEAATEISSPSEDANAPVAMRRRRRRRAAIGSSTPALKNTNHSKDVIAEAWRDGVYLLVVGLEPQRKDVPFDVSMTVEMKSDYGYLSAGDYPKRPFYLIMCLLYVVYGVAWMIALASKWRDLLQIQFWIGGVIILGTLEKAVFYTEYQTINSTGVSMPGAVLFAEIVSCGKRTLARMLVIIVSLGFGIVKPRLGPLLHRILLLGGVYFVLGSVEAGLRNFKHSADQSQQILLAGIPLAVIDAGICWWVFSSLVQTMRTLRLRRNTTKLGLFRHLTNVIIFSVIASVVFMIWSIRSHRIADCLADWKELWVDDAFWHLLFSILLAVIMVLWRPTANNQRYAFSALLDDAEDADPEEEPMMTEAYEGMKLRSHVGDGAPGKDTSGIVLSSSKSVDDKFEEDLKWVEENIPTSVADAALPSLLDSDEEIMTTKFEMSKME